MTRFSLIIVMPVYNDLHTANALLKQIDQVLVNAPIVARVILLDDGSRQPIKADELEGPFKSIAAVEPLRMRRNLGHQRAIAVGLVHIYKELTCDAILVMDADGQDKPEDILRLVQRFQETAGEKIIFAERTKRSENLTFRVFYQSYRLLHRVLTGIPVRVGNFSIIPFGCLSCLVVVSELWSHYAAAVFKVRLPHESIPMERNPRLSGESKMNFVALLAHGLRALSVFSETVAIRFLLFFSFLFLSVGGLAILMGIISATTSVTMAPWAIWFMGLLLATLMLIVMVAGGVVFFVMNNRSRQIFLPIRDCGYFILNPKRTCPTNE
ncbi:glycosyltransferase [Candidatus Hydrogenedentota bacterium]